MRAHPAIVTRFDPEEVLSARPGAPRLRRVAVKHRGRIVLVAFDEVDWVKAAGNYSMLHVRSEQYTVRATTAEMLDTLGVDTFARINRGTIVRMDLVEELRPRGHNDYSVVLRDGTTLVLSRRYKASFLKATTGRR